MNWEDTSLSACRSLPTSIITLPFPPELAQPRALTSLVSTVQTSAVPSMSIGPDETGKITSTQVCKISIENNITSSQLECYQFINITSCLEEQSNTKHKLKTNAPKQFTGLYVQRSPSTRKPTLLHHSNNISYCLPIKRNENNSNEW